MQTTKPADTLLFLGRQSRNGRPLLTVTAGYACERDGSRMSEQAALAWILPQFTDRPFDVGLKRTRGVFAMAGDAFAPGHAPATGLTLTASVGEIRKSLLVQGDRRWTRGLTGLHPGAAAPFTSHPIGLAQAYGAKGWLGNPTGCGRYATLEEAEGQALPNVEYPGSPMLAPLDVVSVATFGALPPTSPERTRWLGTFDERWSRANLPWLPADTDPRWFDEVPQDQCAASYWQGNESWSASNMNADQPLLRGVLPGLRPRLLVRTTAAPGQCVEPAMDLDTVWLFPNTCRVVVMYRAEIAVQYEDASDVAAIAIYTEQQRDARLPTEHYAKLWLAPPPAQTPPAASGQDEAEPSAVQAERAALALNAAAQRGRITRKIAKARKDALDQGAPWRGAAAGNSAPPVVAAATEANHGNTASAAPKIADEIRALIRSRMEQHQAEARAHLAQYGVNLDDAVAHARAQALPDPLEVLAGLPIAAEKKAELVARTQALLTTAKALKDRTGAISAPSVKGEAGAKEIPAGATAGPPESSEARRGTPPGGPRQRLTRETLEARHRTGQSCAWTELDGEDLSGADLAGIDLSRSRLHACVLRGAVLNGARLTQAQFEDCDLGDASLDGAQLRQAQLTDCGLEHAGLDNADFSQARLERCRLSYASAGASRWKNADVRGCDFSHAVLAQAETQHATFNACQFDDADMAQGTFDWTSFRKCALNASRCDAASLNNATLLACQCTGASFAEAHMHGFRTQRGTSFERARLDNADMTGASLQDTVLQHASLRAACLTRALVKNCDLSATDGWHATARKADFTGSSFVNASWRGANLMQAGFARARLENLDLGGANLYAAATRTASVQGVTLDQALLTRCRIIPEHT